MNRIILICFFILPAFYSQGQITTSSFLPHLDFPTDSADDPEAVAVHDLDGDNKPEIVVVSLYGPGISVYRNTTKSGIMDSGSFAPRQDFAVAPDAGMVRLADMDGDSKYDIVVASYEQVTILRNTSTIDTISFDNPVYLDAIPGANDFEMALDDINGDGKTDIIILDNIVTDTALYGYYSVITNNIQSPGAFTSASFNARLDYSTGEQFVETITTGDIDGDGKEDIVVALTEGSLFIYRNISTSTVLDTGSFDVPDTLLGINAVDVDVFDFDLDGKKDLVISEGQTWLTLVRNNNNPGSIVTSNFNSYARFDLAPSGTNPQRLTINDFDGDGKPDVAIANSGPSVVSVLRNVSTPGSLTTSSLDAPVNFSTPDRPNGMASADLDGDGRIDIVAVDGVNGIGSLISIFQNNTAGITSVSSFLSATNLNVYPNPTSGTVNIQAVNNISKVSILTVTGKECYTGVYNASNIVIDVANLVKGMYLVEVYTADGKNSVSKLSVE